MLERNGVSRECVEPRNILVGRADGFPVPEGSIGCIEKVRGILSPGVRDSATALQGNDRNLGDPYRCTERVIGRNNRRGRKSEGGKGVGLSHSSEEVK